MTLAFFPDEAVFRTRCEFLEVSTQMSFVLKVNIPVGQKMLDKRVSGMLSAAYTVFCTLLHGFQECRLESILEEVVVLVSRLLLSKCNIIGQSEDVEQWIYVP